jgi:phospholipid transport system transporter-binding protein
MQQLADITWQNEQLFVSGELTFYNVLALYQTSLAFFNHSAEILYFNFAKLTASDSAGLALIIEWIKYARHHQKTIRFQQLSVDLLSLAKAAGIDELII